MLGWLSNFWQNKQILNSDLPLIEGVKNIRGKRVLLRSALNVPIVDGKVSETFRLEQALPTIKWLQSKGAKVIVIAHIGRDENETLKPVYDVLQKLVKITWGGTLTEARESLANQKNGEVILLENLRQDKREVEAEQSLAEELAAIADIYVNDAFADSHRNHTSITGVPKYLPSYFGNSFNHEYQALKQAINPVSPSVFILGGAKFETKMPLVLNYSSTYDQIFIGGALANDIYKAKGYEVGKSLVSDVDLSNSEILRNPKIVPPVDVVVDGPQGVREVGPRAVKSTEIIMDAGPTSLKDLEAMIANANSVLWNGPLGNFEKGFTLGTEMLARIIAKSNAYSVVGGGDTIAAIRSLNLENNFSFMSTAGGAMLVFLETGTLPAIEAVVNKD